MATSKKTSKKTKAKTETKSGEVPKGTETLESRVARLMAEQKLSQAALAKRAGIDRSVLNRTLSGQRRFRTQDLEWLAPSLDLTVEQLLEGLDESPPIVGVRDELGALQKRVLEAEAERDGARSLLKTATAAVELERTRTKSEREALLKSAKAEREAFERRLDEAQKTAAARERELRASLAEAEKQSFLDRNRIAELEQACADLGGQAEYWSEREKTTQAQLARSEASKVPTMILSGLLGSVVTGLITGSRRGAADDEDDDDDDEGDDED